MEEVGTLHLERRTTDELSAGDVGYIIAGIKDISDIAVGRHGHDRRGPRRGADSRLSRRQACRVLVDLSRVDGRLSKTSPRRSKSSSSTTLRSPSRRTPRQRWDSGFAAAFWGCLHLDVVQERLEREYGLSLVLIGAVGPVPDDDERGPRGGDRQPQPLPRSDGDQECRRALHQGRGDDARALRRCRSWSFAAIAAERRCQHTTTSRSGVSS